jgi:4-coumarate--CoA ligase
VRIVELASDDAAPAAASDALVDVAPGVEGELCVSGPQVMSGYLNMPDASARTLWTDPSDGRVWLRTGDVARVDADSFVFITDRAKELIKVKGLQVAPAELEALLLTHPLVLDAAVIPVADAASGELPRAYVVLRAPADGAPHADRAAEANLIADFVAGVVAPHKRLRGGVVVTDRIPKSASGKILRRLIRDQDRAQQHAHQHHERAPRERA